MKYLFSLFFACLFVVSCTCDEGYCPIIEDITIEINYSNDFTLEELRRSRIVIIDTVLQSTIDSYNMIDFMSDRRTTNIHYFEEFPSMDNIFILNFDDFSDTIRNLRYEPTLTTYQCAMGCGNGSVTAERTELSNFYLIHQADTIRDKTVFIEK